MDILRFLTAGSVDDGKSTLIGRLLYDSKNILADQLEAIEKSSKNRENGEVDLALLTDGLRAEREQGITIDVAYKYFSTPKRKFIIADAPGHIQYTRNMITGASNTDLIIILIDARNGIIEQTKRHSIIASLLKIPHIIVAINKMDLVDFSKQKFDEIKEEYQKIAQTLELKKVEFIPISALKGDNIVEKSTQMDWYDGESLLEKLENLTIEKNTNLEMARFPVQIVLRPQTQTHHDYRGYAGKIQSGIFKTGDKIKIYPSDISATISSIEVSNQPVQEAFAPQSVVIHLHEDVDISRGSLICKDDETLKTSNELQATICWLDEKPMHIGGKYLLQHNNRIVNAMIKEIIEKIDVNTLEHHREINSAHLNEVVNVKLKTSAPIYYDPYETLRETGSALLIDPTSNISVGAVLLK